MYVFKIFVYRLITIYFQPTNSVLHESWDVKYFFRCGGIRCILPIKSVNVEAKEAELLKLQSFWGSAADIMHGCVQLEKEAKA